MGHLKWLVLQSFGSFLLTSLLLPECVSFRVEAVNSKNVFVEIKTDVNGKLNEKNRLMEWKCALNYSIFHPKTIYFLLGTRKIHELRVAKTLAMNEVDEERKREKRKTENNYTSRIVR